MQVNLSHAWFLTYGLYGNRPYGPPGHTHATRHDSAEEEGGSDTDTVRWHIEPHIMARRARMDIVGW